MDSYLIIELGSEHYEALITTELDYIVISVEELNLFGYGSTINEALAMLEEDYLTYLEDRESFNSL